MKLPVCLTAALLGLLCVNFCSSARAQDPGVASPPDLPQVQVQPSLSANTVVIPGPLRSFLRMAGISQKIHPGDVLPLLSRNVFTEGYKGRGRPTEFLILLIRYVQQARELTALTGPDGMIRVSTCEGAGPLLHVLGYRPRRDCGQGQTALETSDSEKAFLTVDSGFPLPELERTLRREITYTLPSDKAIPVSVNRGQPVVVDNPKSRVARSLQEIAQSLHGAVGTRQ